MVFIPAELMYAIQVTMVIGVGALSYWLIKKLRKKAKA